MREEAIHSTMPDLHPQTSTLDRGGRWGNQLETPKRRFADGTCWSSWRSVCLVAAQGELDRCMACQASVTAESRRLVCLTRRAHPRRGVVAGTPQHDQEDLRARGSRCSPRRGRRQIRSLRNRAGLRVCCFGQSNRSWNAAHQRKVLGVTPEDEETDGDK